MFSSLSDNAYDFFAELEGSHNTSLVLVIYDIVDNKSRRKLVTILNSFGKRVQKSCYETFLTEKQYSNLRKEIDKFTEGKYFKKEADSIRVYKISASTNVIAYGMDEVRENEMAIVL